MSQMSLEEAKRVIYSVDLGPVIDRLVKIEKWSKHEAEAAAQQYSNYLFLRKKHPCEKLPPSKDIDEVWHAHILHTEEYRTFCKQAFNEQPDHYLDHHPHMAKEGTMKNLNKLFEKTQSLYHQEFGEYIYQIRDLSFFRKFLNRIREFLLIIAPKLAKELQKQKHTC